ncbi:Ig-like domain-containing protein [Streptomyces fractus]|uniref:L,D-transpeptidase n=1 Tax=Streptomyces fractus TaxID=641806 RepID=UPI003CF5AD4D
MDGTEEPSKQPKRGLTRRQLFGWIAGGTAGAAVIGGGLLAAGRGSGPLAEPTSDAVITLPAVNGAYGVSINKCTVKVSRGALTSVALTDSATGDTVAGTYNAEKTAWTATGALDRGVKYTVVARAKDSSGVTAKKTADFTTVTPDASYIGTYAFDDGDQVGVGMPVSITFDKTIADKRAVQQAIGVTSTAGVAIVGCWLSDTRLDFRPEKYWPKGTKVTLKMATDGVKGADRLTGVQQTSASFSVGRSQVSTVDNDTQTLTVVRDGSAYKTVAVSAGSDAHSTYNGIMVISERYKEMDMDGDTVGFTGSDSYDIEDVPHAQRLTASGTFIHGNYWSPSSAFGQEGTSHGCIGIQDDQPTSSGSVSDDTTAAWFYANSMVGDVVVVKNSPSDTVSADNGLNGWNMSWSDWQAGSAV